MVMFFVIITSYKLVLRTSSITYLIKKNLLKKRC